MIDKNEILELVKSCIAGIDDEYRASPDDDEPGMQLTVATNDERDAWSFQTGDNSYTGGTYGLPHWAVVSLYRDTEPVSVVEDIFSQWDELVT